MLQNILICTWLLWMLSAISYNYVYKLRRNSIVKLVVIQSGNERYSDKELEKHLRNKLNGILWYSAREEFWYKDQKYQFGRISMNIDMEGAWNIYVTVENIDPFA